MANCDGGAREGDYDKWEDYDENMIVMNTTLLTTGVMRTASINVGRTAGKTQATYIRLCSCFAFVVFAYTFVLLKSSQVKRIPCSTPFNRTKIIPDP